MNYLAHFHLAQSVATATGHSEQGLVIGGLLGDFVKGPLKSELAEDWETGIRLHRRIDALTDHHPLSKECLEALPVEYRRYGGIMLDLCFDYCLSQHWPNYHPAPIKHFTAAAYRYVLEHQDKYSAPAARQIQLLARHDVLAGMADWDQVTAMLDRIGQRLKRDNPLAQCAPTLKQQLPLINARFSELYPQLQSQLCREFSRD